MLEFFDKKEVKMHLRKNVVSAMLIAGLSISTVQAQTVGVSNDKVIFGPSASRLLSKVRLAHLEPA